MPDTGSCIGGSVGMWNNSKVISDRLAWRQRWCSDPLAWILSEQPLFCPRPSASSAVLSPPLCAFHAAPSLSAAECHPRPLPVCFIKPVLDEAKAWRQLFRLRPSFKPGIWSRSCRMALTLYGASDISACLLHNIFSWLHRRHVTTLKWRLRKQSRQIKAPLHCISPAAHQKKWYEKKSRPGCHPCLHPVTAGIGSSDPRDPGFQEK